MFPVIVAHLRRLEPLLLALEDFHDVLSTIKAAECASYDADELIDAVMCESARIQPHRLEELREISRGSLRDERERTLRVRALNEQLAIAYDMPVFSTYAASLARFYEQAEGASRSDVAFILSLLCHGLVWVAEHSRQWAR